MHHSSLSHKIMQERDQVLSNYEVKVEKIRIIQLSLKITQALNQDEKLTSESTGFLRITVALYMENSSLPLSNLIGYLCIIPHVSVPWGVILNMIRSNMYFSNGSQKRCQYCQVYFYHPFYQKSQKCLRAIFILILKLCSIKKPIKRYLNHEYIIFLKVERSEFKYDSVCTSFWCMHINSHPYLQIERSDLLYCTHQAKEISPSITQHGICSRWGAREEGGGRQPQCSTGKIIIIVSIQSVYFLQSY